MGPSGPPSLPLRCPLLLGDRVRAENPFIPNTKRTVFPREKTRGEMPMTNTLLHSPKGVDELCGGRYGCREEAVLV